MKQYSLAVELIRLEETRLTYLQKVVCSGLEESASSALGYNVQLVYAHELEANEGFQEFLDRHQKYFGDAKLPEHLQYHANENNQDSDAQSE
jgi:hypothetical protein